MVQLDVPLQSGPCQTFVKETDQKLFILKPNRYIGTKGFEIKEEISATIIFGEV